MRYSPQIVSAYYRQELVLTPDFEWRFHPDRKWRFDIVFLPESAKVAVEVQGGAFVYGAHSRGAGMIKDMEKLRAALELGWLVTYCTPEDVCMLWMVEHVRKLIARQVGKAV